MIRHIMLAWAFSWFVLPSYADDVGTVRNALQCIESKLPEHLPNGIDLVPARLIELNPPYILVHGDLGWHLTWAVLFETNKDAIVAFETYGAIGDMTGAFARMPVPDILRRALITCDVDWKGLWPHDWPERSSPTALPTPDPAERVWNFPHDDLLPPPHK